MTDDLTGTAAKEMLRNIADDKGSAYREQLIGILTQTVIDCGIPPDAAALIAEETLGKFGTPGVTNG